MAKDPIDVRVELEHAQLQTLEDVCCIVRERAVVDVVVTVVRVQELLLRVVQELETLTDGAWTHSSSKRQSVVRLRVVHDAETETEDKVAAST